MSTLRHASLDRKMTAEQFIAWVAAEVEVEAHFTEANNEDRTLGDYIADLETRLTRIRIGEITMDNTEDTQRKP